MQTIYQTQNESRIERAERELRIHIEMGLPGLPVNNLSKQERRQFVRRTGVDSWIVALMNQPARDKLPFEEILRAGEALRGLPA